MIGDPYEAVTDITYQASISTCSLLCCLGNKRLRSDLVSANEITLEDF